MDGVVWFGCRQHQDNTALGEHGMIEQGELGHVSMTVVSWLLHVHLSAVEFDAMDHIKNKSCALGETRPKKSSQRCLDRSKNLHHAFG